MTRTQYYTATSIDGFIADENNSLQWLFDVDSGGEGENKFGSFFAGVGAMCMGSVTYEWVYEHDRLSENPVKWKDYYGDTPCWVFTHRDLPAIAGANLTFVSGDVVPVHDAMTAAAGGRNVWIVGGGELVGKFADAGRLDEVLLSVAPVTLGAGAPLLPRRLMSSRLKLTEAVKNGQFAQLTYIVNNT